MQKNKKLILGLLMVALLLVVGVTYAFFTYENGTRSEIVTGQIYLNYTEENQITLTNAWPETKESAMQRTDNVFNFTIEGQNTSREDIYYAIKINYADDIAGKNRIASEHIRIYLECDGEVLVDGLTYQDWNDKKIEIATIPAGTTNMITKNYSLRMWIDENVAISDTSSSADYTTSEWNNTYANMIINVVGQTSTYVPVTSYDLSDEVETNYATYLTEADDNGTRFISGTSANITNNYVRYNDMLWRIVGINSDGSLKLVTQDSITKMQWNSTDYGTSGIRTWLNNDFYNTLNQDLIVEGTWDYSSFSLDTSTYQLTINEERSLKDNVGLLSSFDYWKVTDFSIDVFNTGVYEGTHAYDNYLINGNGFGLTNSISSDSLLITSVDDYGNWVHYDGIYSEYIRPSINLISGVKFVDGDGSKNNPYILEGDVDYSLNNYSYIVYDDNGGSFTPKETNLLYENRVTLQKPVMENKAFLGWSSDRNATEPEYKAGDTYTGNGGILYAVYGDTRNVMTNLEVIPYSVYEEIDKVYFINETQINIDTRYDAATNKWDLTLDNQGSVKGWIETDAYGINVLYIGSEGTTYLSICKELFSDWSANEIDFTNVDTSMVTDMSDMFAYSGVISLDLRSFNTSNVTNMSYMFNGYDGALVKVDVSSFDTSKVTDMSGMFSVFRGDSLDLSNFDTSNVVSMEYMFGSSSLTSLDLSNFDTSSVTNMSSMFDYADLTSINMGNWDTSNVTNMSHMFSSANLTNLDLSDWDTSSVIDMSGMFDYCSNLTSLDLSNWDISSVIDMSRMFEYCSNLTSLDLSNWNIGNVESVIGMFENCANLTTIYANLDWNNENIKNSSWMFNNCTNLVGAVPYDSTKTDITLANPDTGYFTRKEA